MIEKHKNKWLVQWLTGGEIVKAEFIGKDGSMGFCKGRTYQIRTDVKANSNGKVFLWVYDINSKLYCPYSRLETMLDNWMLIDESRQN